MRRSSSTAIAGGLVPVGEVKLARFGELPQGAAEEATLPVLGATDPWFPA